MCTLGRQDESRQSLNHGPPLLICSECIQPYTDQLPRRSMFCSLSAYSASLASQLYRLLCRYRLQKNQRSKMRDWPLSTQLPYMLLLCKCLPQSDACADTNQKEAQFHSRWYPQVNKDASTALLQHISWTVFVQFAWKLTVWKLTFQGWCGGQKCLPLPQTLDQKAWNCCLNCAKEVSMKTPQPKELPPENTFWHRMALITPLGGAPAGRAGGARAGAGSTYVGYLTFRLLQV